MVIVTRYTQLSAGPRRGIFADISGPMTPEDAARFIAEKVRNGQGCQGDYSWRDANSEPE